MLKNKEHFYKYVTAETALLILQNRTLKYSSPILFNDPFDTQTKIAFSFDMSEFMERFTDGLYGLAHDDKEPVGDDDNALFKDIKIWRNMAKNNYRKMPKAVFKQKTRPIAQEAVNHFNRYFEEVNSWWMGFVRASRVFCLAEDRDNLLMWAHYARDHTGVVIELKCLPELDTNLCVARKVNYVQNPPIIAKIDEYINYITGREKLDYDLLFSDMILSKSQHWAY